MRRVAGLILGVCAAVLLVPSQGDGPVGGGHRMPLVAAPAPPPAKTAKKPAAAVPRHASPPARQLVAYRTVSPKGSGPLVLRTKPGGLVVAKMGASLFGGPVVLSVVRWKGAWAGVASETLPNGVLGWVNTRAGVVVSSVPTKIHVQLSKRELHLYRNGRVVRLFRVAVGSPSSPTPTGRYAIAEKLPGSRGGAVYGCCILGLTAHQPVPPTDWNPNRTYLVAIHGGGGVGQAVSAGCLHLSEPALRYLMRAVPLGTPVIISA
jgi:lipoprotein-anchoring transpeptidase ErfK/SrfK